MIPKIIAFHLPQFHQIPENNEWWGEGFTEWTNTKKSRPLFKGHNQPRIPLNNNYYDLTNKSTIEWQSRLAKEYGVDGFCYYHYWFKGKKLLEKPVEILVKEKSISTEFCLCWANEPWTRSWDGKTRQILMNQEYGHEKDWEEHIKYLLPIFQDPRYIKKNNKPVFVIYRTNNVPNLDKMILFWDKFLIDNGFFGIEIIEMLTSFQSKPCSVYSNFVIEFEPMNTLRHLQEKDNLSIGIITKLKGLIRRLNIRGISDVKKLLKIYDYDLIWQEIIERNNHKYENKSIIHGGFVDWDNSARKGRNATIFSGGNPHKFEYYLEKQFDKVYKNKGEYLFINAWNEWAEGTYLEPDTRNEYAYLEAIQRIKSKYQG